MHLYSIPSTTVPRGSTIIMPQCKIYVTAVCTDLQGYTVSTVIFRFMVESTGNRAWEVRV